MIAQRIVPHSDGDEVDVIDADTSAAVLHWMETGDVPPGVDPDAWEQWADDGCRQPLVAGGVTVTPAMLGAWARTGELR